MVQAVALRMNTSPGSAWVKACSTRSTDSASDIRNRVIVGSVTVSGWPLRSCSTKSGMTEPREYITLPYRTQETVVARLRVVPGVRLGDLLHQRLGHAHRVDRLDGLVGAEEHHDPTPLRSQASMTLALPSTFVRTRFQREELARRHLLERGGVEDVARRRGSPSTTESGSRTSPT